MKWLSPWKRESSVKRVKCDRCFKTVPTFESGRMMSHFPLNINHPMCPGSGRFLDEQ